ncbi:MAG: hypothetical protein IPK55_11840 [Streptococcus sp.]|nr:hypothetical protein [Streptococcus sp.]
MKFEINKTMISPFETQLLSCKFYSSNLIFSLQIGFFIELCLESYLSAIALLDLIKDYKEKILLGRRGEYPGFVMEEVEVKDSANFPGFIISTSVAGFVIVVGLITIVFTLAT